ncbi:MAG: ATP-binding cassette domain-containing protein, partial [Aggregatilineales bacterium]
VRLEWIFGLFPAIKKFWLHPAGKLSGGQKQMLAVSRAIVEPRKLLLIDEPSEGLAPVIIEALMHAIRRLLEAATVLLVEQNFRMASRLADRYVIIDDGASVQSGMMADLVNDEATIQRYLGAA